ncbi:MAG TPA: thiamine pyrophosphate-dependent enzyme [Xanthobacteraceae bacterium]|nr:thiamine pyrophosphate-dependent enzyme [Xanthobacteraceae bacterium]
MKRIEVIRGMAQVITKDDLLTTSIGQTWDDWWNYKPADNTFFTGILGSVTTTALGLAVSLPHRRIIAIESDGSVLLNTGVMCTLGKERPPNLTVVVMDNGIYENIGGPPTHTAANTDLAKMAEGAGCLNCVTVGEADEFDRQFRCMLDDAQMGYLVAKIEPWAKHQWEWKDRKATDGVEDKYRFLRYVEKLEGIVIHPAAVQN